jgi:hypothetical protein
MQRKRNEVRQTETGKAREGKVLLNYRGEGGLVPVTARPGCVGLRRVETKRKRARDRERSFDS